MVYTDPTCTVKLLERVVHFERYGTSARTCRSVGSRGQYVAIAVAERGELFYVDHCTSGGINGGIFLVPNEDDLEVQSCRSGGSTPYCPYSLSGAPQRFHCNQWCLLESIWIGGPNTPSCLTGGLAQPLSQGEPFNLYEITDCAPTSQSIIPDQLNARITPFRDAQRLLGISSTLVRIQTYSGPTCTTQVGDILLRDNDCASNIQRNTFGSCQDLKLEYFGTDNYGCHMRHVLEISTPPDSFTNVSFRLFKGLFKGHFKGLFKHFKGLSRVSLRVSSRQRQDSKRDLDTPFSLHLHLFTLIFTFFCLIIDGR